MERLIAKEFVSYVEYKHRSVADFDEKGITIKLPAKEGDELVFN